MLVGGLCSIGSNRRKYMERSNNVGSREDQSNSNGNEEIQLSSTGNQRNTLDPNWTEKASYGRDAAILRSRRGQCSAHSGSRSYAVQSSTKCTCDTIFPHKRIHKATWISPDHTTENQIDHICINEKFRRIMEDVRTRRGADVASDHHLVMANLKMKLKKNWTSGQTALQRFNTALLQYTDKLNEFKIALNNRFQALQDLLKEEETSMEDNWKGIKEALTLTCQEVLGLKKYHHKEWISTKTLDKIKERKNKKAAINNSRTRAEKVQAQAEYIEANKQVKRSIGADKKKYVEELATMAEKAAREGNMKQLQDTTKKLAEKYSKPERPVKDKEGKPITEIQQQRNRWVEYSEELLNRPAPMNPPDIEAAHTDLPIDVNPPTKEEIRIAVRQIRSGKAA
ncbi:unnamed protein product, partial [Schistosoma margrebowiei]